MRLVDKNNMVMDIKLRMWDGTQYSPDFSSDFFDAGSLPFIDGLNAHFVEDVDYCRDQAMDWKNAEGDYREWDNDISQEELERRSVDAEIYSIEAVAKEVPVYYGSVVDAFDNKEMRAFQLSYDLDAMCRRAIEDAVTENYSDDYRFDSSAAVRDVVNTYGEERVGVILAANIQRLDYDGRISPQNKEWAKDVEIPKSDNTNRYDSRVCLNRVHAGLIDLFTTNFRRGTYKEKQENKRHDKPRESERDER